MKKSILICSILTAGITASTSASAWEISDETKQSGVVLGTVATGALAGGPLGALLGAFAGSWLGEQVATADQVESVESELADARAEADLLSRKLAASEEASNDYQQFALQQLQLELLFKTGASELTLPAQLKMSLLASLLLEQPKLMVRLDGYADPRGDANYNQTLSAKRVQVVQEFLITKGVAPERFTIHSHGASQSQATLGDYDDYALERVVKVELSNPAQNQQQDLVQTVMP